MFCESAPLYNVMLRIALKLEGRLFFQVGAGSSGLPLFFGVFACAVTKLVAPVFTIVLAFLCSSFTDFALVL